MDESALTGESLPVTKYPGSEVLAGGVVKIGEIDCIVTKTGVVSQHSFFPWENSFSSQAIHCNVLNFFGRIIFRRYFASFSHFFFHFDE